MMPAGRKESSARFLVAAELCVQEHCRFEDDFSQKRKGSKADMKLK
jgi:hypothetical protein